MRNAYIHKSKINRSEGRLFITTSAKRNSTLIYAELFWLDSDSSLQQARINIERYCERFDYIIIEETQCNT